MITQLGLPFLCFAALFILVVLTLLLFMLRRLQLRNALGTIDASILYRNQRWRMGVCRYRNEGLQWFRLFSLSPKPKYSFSRAELELKSRRRPTEAEQPFIRPGWVVVTIAYQGKEVELSMKFAAYAGLSSWLEAGPAVGVESWR